MKQELKDKLRLAFKQDPSILCDRDNIEGYFGSNPDYLLDVFGVTKNELIRLEREGLSAKCRYATAEGHRTRWLIFNMVLEWL